MSDEKLSQLCPIGHSIGKLKPRIKYPPLTLLLYCNKGPRFGVDRSLRIRGYNGLSAVSVPPGDDGERIMGTNNSLPAVLALTPRALAGA